MILALNLNAIMKKLALGKAWEPKRMKAIRFSFINLPGRIVEHYRRLWIRLSKKSHALDLLINARKKIAMLQAMPAG